MFVFILIYIDIDIIGTVANGRTDVAFIHSIGGPRNPQ